MPVVKAIEARLPVSDVERSAASLVNTLGFEITTLWPQPKPAFAILRRDGVRVQLGRDEGQTGSSTRWLDLEELAVILSEVTGDPPTCVDH